MLLDSGRAQEAVDLLAPLLVVHADDADLWCLNAHALLAVDRNADAMASAKQASALRPTAAEPHRIASLVLTKVGDLEGSARAAREGVRLEPDDAGRLGTALLRPGRPARRPRFVRATGRTCRGSVRWPTRCSARPTGSWPRHPTSSSAYAARGYALAAARRPDLAADAYTARAAARPREPGGAAGAGCSERVAAAAARRHRYGRAGATGLRREPPPPPTSAGSGSFLTGRWGSRLALIIALLLVVTLAVSVLI